MSARATFRQFRHVNRHMYTPIRAGLALMLAGVLGACASAAPRPSTGPAGQTASLSTINGRPAQVTGPGGTVTAHGSVGAATPVPSPPPHRTCAVTVTAASPRIEVSPNFNDPYPIGLCIRPGTRFLLTFNPRGSLPRTTWAPPQATSGTTNATTVENVTRNINGGWAATIQATHPTTTELATSSSNPAEGVPTWMVTIRLIVAGG